MHRTAFTALAAAAVAAGAMGVPAADAATLEQLINDNPRFSLEDDSAEGIGQDLNGNGRLDEGDTFRGVFSFPFFNSVTTGERFELDGTTNSAVHGVFEGQVATKSPAGGGLFNYTFEPYEGFADRVDGPEGATFALYESDTRLNPFNCGDRNACEAAATNGEQRLVVGFEDGTGTYTTGSAPDDVEAARDVAQSDNIAPYDFQLSVLSDDLDVLPFINVPGNDSEVVGSGQILGSAGSQSEFPTFNDADIEMSVVPIPAALPLFLAGLGALGMIGWRRNAV